MSYFLGGKHDGTYGGVRFFRW